MPRDKFSNDVYHELCVEVCELRDRATSSGALEILAPQIVSTLIDLRGSAHSGQMRALAVHAGSLLCLAFALSDEIPYCEAEGLLFRLFLLGSAASAFAQSGSDGFPFAITVSPRV